MCCAYSQPARETILPAAAPGIIRCTRMYLRWDTPIGVKESTVNSLFVHRGIRGQRAKFRFSRGDRPVGMAIPGMVLSDASESMREHPNKKVDYARAPTEKCRSSFSERSAFLDSAVGGSLI